MHITCNTQTLAVELRILNKIAPAKPTIPILAYVLFRADTDLTLEATDLELGLRTSCRATILEPGTAALPAVKLLELIEQFPEGEVRIEQQGLKTVVSAGAFRSRLQALPAEDFQALPEMEGTVSTLVLHPLIERTRYAIAQKTSKFTLDGALLKLNSTAAMIATDGKRLALATAPYSGPELSETIPSKTLEVLLDFDGPLEIAQGERHLFFKAGPRLLISRKLEGQFPAYERIIPRNNDKRILLNRHALAAALRRVAVVSEVNFATYFTIIDQVLTLSSSSAEIGEAIEEVPCRYSGPPIPKLCVNWRFVLDFLEASSAEQVKIELKDENTPMLLTDGTDFLNVVMLMRA